MKPISYKALFVASFFAQKQRLFCLIAVFCMANFINAQQNLIDGSNWTTGNGSFTTPSGVVLNQYGQTNSNIRQTGTVPHSGAVSVVWELTDANTGASQDGGWTSDYIAINPNQTYRFSVWIKRETGSDGTLYFGTNAKDSSNGDAIYTSSGQLVSNAYNYFTGINSIVPKDGNWYLVVAFVYGNGQAATPQGAVYKTDGTVQSSSVGYYTLGANATQLLQRLYRVSGSAGSNSIYAWNPTIHEVNGQEPTLQELLNGQSSSDTTPPTDPTNLTASNITSSSINLSWTASTDASAVTYSIFRDGSVIASNVSSTSYTANGLSASTTYAFKVRAVDAAGNNSTNDSNTINPTTSSSADTTPPSTPTNLSANNTTENSVNLSWTASTDSESGVAGYIVYQDGVAINSNVSGTSYTVTGLSPSTSYEFRIKAFDHANNQGSSTLALTVNTAAPSGGSGSTVWNESGSNIYYNSGNVSIGVTNPGTYKLAVEGHIRAREIRVDNDSWPDYVFASDYKLPTLQEVKKHIEDKGHLINIPSAKEIEENGLQLGEMNKLLLEKIEELTLYILELESKDKKKEYQLQLLMREIQNLKK